MTFEQLRVFVTVAEHLHFTRAAQALNLTQPAVSASVAALESTYNLKLFHRVGRRIELTDAGRVFLEDARAVLQHVRETEDHLVALSQLPQGRLNIAASQTVGTCWLPSFIHRLHCEHPEIALHLHIANTVQVAVAVREGVADLGVVEGEVEDPSLDIRPVAGDRLVLVVGRGHPWAGRKRVELDEFAETAWVIREKGSGTRRLFEQLFAAAGHPPAQLAGALELPNGEAVARAVAAGAGAAVLSELVVASDVRAGLLCQIDAPLPKRTFSLLRHKERFESPASKALAELLLSTSTIA